MPAGQGSASIPSTARAPSNLSTDRRTRRGAGMWRGCCRIGPAGVALPKNMNDQRATRARAQIADSASAAARMALGRGCEKSLVHARVMLLAAMRTEHAHGHACDLQQCSLVRFDTASDRFARSRALECERAHFSLPIAGILARGWKPMG